MLGFRCFQHPSDHRISFVPDQDARITVPFAANPQMQTLKFAVEHEASIVFNVKLCLASHDLDLTLEPASGKLQKHQCDCFMLFPSPRDLPSPTVPGGGTL